MRVKRKKREKVNKEEKILEKEILLNFDKKRENTAKRGEKKEKKLKGRVLRTGNLSYRDLHLIFVPIL